MATADIFLDIPGVKGESVDTNHKDKIEVLSFQWGETNMPNRSGSGMGAGKVSPSDLVIVKLVDSSSNKLAQACAAGDHFAPVNLWVRKAGGDQLDYLQFELGTDSSVGAVFISSYSINGTGTDNVLPTETVTLAFTDLKIHYNKQGLSGAGSGDAILGYDFATAAKL